MMKITFYAPLIKLHIFGDPWWLVMKWDGWLNQVKHFLLHFIAAWLLHPWGSFCMAVGIEGTDGFVGAQRQGADIIDFASRFLGAATMQFLLFDLGVPSFPAIVLEFIIERMV